MSQLKDWEVLAAMVAKDKSFNPQEADGVDPVEVPEGFKLCPGCEYPGCLFGEEC